MNGGGRARPRHGRATATQLQHRDAHPAAADARRPRRPAAAAGARETTNTHHHRQPPLYFGPSASLGRRTIYAALRTAHGALSAREDPYAPTSRRRPRHTDLTAPALAAPSRASNRQSGPSAASLACLSAPLLSLTRLPPSGPRPSHHAYSASSSSRSAAAIDLRVFASVLSATTSTLSLSAPDLSVPAFTEDTTSSHPSIF